MNAKV